MIGLIIVGIFIFLELYDIHCDLKEINITLRKNNDILETSKPKRRVKDGE